MNESDLSFKLRGSTSFNANRVGFSETLDTKEVVQSTLCVNVAAINGDCCVLSHIMYCEDFNLFDFQKLARTHRAHLKDVNEIPCSDALMDTHEDNVFLTCDV